MSRQFHAWKSFSDLDLRRVQVDCHGQRHGALLQLGHDAALDLGVKPRQQRPRHLHAFVHGLWHHGHVEVLPAKGVHQAQQHLGEGEGR